MSLQALATNMATQGRGPDSMLVHMAPREVAGLQSLAMAHGGSLTINPATGLPEAGFLSNLLPTLIGGALSVASGGALTPLMAGLMTGAGYGVATGNLKKGLMAGLGAFGGAGLGAGLSAAGAAEAALPGAAPVSAEGLAPFSTNAADYARFEATPTSPSAFEMRGSPLPTEPLTSVGSHSLFDAAGQPLNSPLAGHPMSFEAAAPAPVTPMATPTPAPTYSPGFGTETAKAAAQEQALSATMTDNFKQAGKGLTSLMDSQAGRDAFLGQAGKEGVEATGVGGLGGLARYGSAAATPMLLDQRTGSGYKPDTEQYKYAYDLNRNPDPQGSYTGAPTGERQWFSPKFTRLYADGGQTQSSEDALKYLTSTDPSGRTNDLTGVSRQTYDYLMGNGLGYRPPVQTQSALPATRYLEPTGGISDIPVTAPPTAIAFPSELTTPDTYDQDNQDAIDKIEQEVADEEYEQSNQDAIDRIEQAVAEEEYNQSNQDAINKIEQEVADENTYNESLNDDELGYLRDNNPYTPAQDETTSVNPTPDSVLNQDEFGDLQGAIERNMNPVQDDGTTEVIQNQVLAQEDPYGKLDDAIAANNLSDSARASDIDAATIGADNNTYSGFDPTSANPTIPVENRSPVVEQPTVVDTPNGGAMVTMPENQYVSNAVADTFDSDTGTYVEVDDAEGDFGDFGGGFGGGRYFDDYFDSMSVANGGLMAAHRYAMGGMSNLGGYSDGGRLLKGPGDGVSDSIPAMIGKKQPARLADGEFVIPARIVSELGNGSTDAGARKLYQMMDRIQAARKKTVGKNRVAVNSRADKMMPV